MLNGRLVQLVMEVCDGFIAKMIEGREQLHIPAWPLHLPYGKCASRSNERGCLLYLPCK